MYTGFTYREVVSFSRRKKAWSRSWHLRLIKQSVHKSMSEHDAHVQRIPRIEDIPQSPVHCTFLWTIPISIPAENCRDTVKCVAHWKSCADMQSSHRIPLGTAIWRVVLQILKEQFWQDILMHRFIISWSAVRRNVLPKSFFQDLENHPSVSHCAYCKSMKAVPKRSFNSFTEPYLPTAPISSGQSRFEDRNPTSRPTTQKSRFVPICPDQRQKTRF